MPGAAVAGTGFGCRVHVPALRAAGFDVVALVGRDAGKTARRAERLGIPHVDTSLTDALARDDVHAVTIATPPDSHASLAIEACRAGRHVLCEKPFALDAREAGSMLDAARDAGVTALVGHEFRWATDRAVVARAIAAGAIGEPRTFSLVSYVPLVADVSAAMPPWWFDEARGGGWLGASGSHVVDQVRVWLGDITEVSASLPTVSARTGGAEDSFVVRCRTSSGAEGVLQQTAASWAPGVAGVTVIAGTEGTIEVVDGDVWCADAHGRRQLAVPPDLRVPDAPSAAEGGAHRYTHLELGPYTRLCEVLRAGVDGSPRPNAVPPPTFDDGLACMRVLDAIRRSAAAGAVSVEVG